MIPTQLGGPTSSQWDGFSPREASEFEGVFVINGIDRFMVTDDRLRYNVCVVSTKRVGKREFVNVELRAEHTDMYRSTSTLNANIMPWTKMQRNENLIHIPYVNDPVPVHILLRALGWTDDIEEDITVEDKITADMYRRACTYFRNHVYKNDEDTLDHATANDNRASETTNNAETRRTSQKRHMSQQGRRKRARTSQDQNSRAAESDEEEKRDDVDEVHLNEDEDDEECAGRATAGMLEIQRKLETKEKLDLREIVQLVRTSMPSSELVIRQRKARLDVIRAATATARQADRDHADGMYDNDVEEDDIAGGDSTSKRALRPCGLLSCICVETRVASANTESNSMRFFNFSNGTFSRVRRKKRRRAGQMPVCTSQEEALLWIALSVDDPGRIRKQMFPSSSTTVGDTTSRTHPRVNRACHVATRSTSVANNDESMQIDSTEKKPDDDGKMKNEVVTDATQKEASVQQEDGGEEEEEEVKEEEKTEEPEEDPSLITGVHVTADQRARYCATFLARQKLLRSSRKTILKEVCPNVAILGESLGWSEEEINKRKADMVLDMLWRGILYMSRHALEDDRDDQGMKTNDDPNFLITSLLRLLVRKRIRGYTRHIVKRHDAKSLVTFRELNADGQFTTHKHQRN